MTAVTAARYGIFFAPDPGTELWQRGCRWLGRDPLDGRTFPPMAVEGLEPDTVERLTANPRHYGFHATLKPPMALVEEMTQADLLDRVSVLAGTLSPFRLHLDIRVDHGFMALRARHGADRARALSDICVTELDDLRRPITRQEIARRRGSGLTGRQDALMLRWGYPYVFDEFWFHMTLTGRIDDPEIPPVRQTLQEWLAPALRQTVLVDSIVVFRQPDRDTPFTVLERFPFGAD